MTDHITLDSLGALTLIDAGGTQGAVFAVPQLRMQLAPHGLVFKRYKPAASESLDVAVLESMPSYLESLPFTEGMELLSLAAWPCRLVDQGGAVIGFVMPHIPDEFFMQMSKASGMSRERAEFQHLLNPESFLARRQIKVTDRLRYELLRETARALAVFHRHGIAVGDLSPKNLLYSCEPASGVYFVDCDSMRIKGRSAIEQAETPGWEVHAVNPGEEKGTVASDSYKLGLLALRLLAGSQDTHDPARLPAAVPQATRDLITLALSADPSGRPAPADWLSPLETAGATASHAIPQARQATALAPPATGSQNQATPPRTTQPQRQPLQSVQTPHKPPMTLPNTGQAGGPVRVRATRLGRRRAWIALTVTVMALAVGAGVKVALHATARHPLATLTAPGANDVYSVAFSPDGKALATGDHNGSTYLWDVTSRSRIATLTDPDSNGVDSVAFSPDGKTLATGDVNGWIYQWNVASHSRIATLLDHAPDVSVDSVAFSPDGKTLAAGIERPGHGAIYLLDVARHSRIATLADPALKGVVSVAFSPDGKTLATVDLNGGISLWDVASRSRIATLAEHYISNPTDWVAFSPDGKTLATVDAAGSIYLWDVASHSWIATLKDHAAYDLADNVTFSPDGKTVATGAGDGNTYLWDVASHSRIATLPFPSPWYCSLIPGCNNGAVDSVAISPDGKTLATGDDKGHIYLWGVSG